MNDSQEQFDQVRRLLVLKRHEIPPPGYFDHFSDRVIARIESETLVLEGSWWRRLVMSFDAKPIVAGAYSLGLGGLLFVGLSLVHVYQQESVETLATSSGWNPAPATTMAEVQQSTSSDPTIGFVKNSDSGSSVTPVISEGAPSFLFRTPGMNSSQIHAQPAFFTPGYRQ